MHLVGMATPQEVKTDLQVVKEALGLLPCPTEAQDEAALQEVQANLKPLLNQTWHTGRHNNRTP